jgi:hypothetical protein
MIEILTNPDKFFEAKKEEEVGLKIPALIVLIVGIISGISSFLQNSITVKMMSEVPPEAQSIVAIMSTVSVIGLVILYLIFWVFIAAIMSTVSVIGLVIVYLIFWVFIAGIFHLLSSIFKGEGDFNRTLEFVGYGYIPMIFGGIISAILMYIIVSTAQIPVVTDPAKIAETLRAADEKPNDADFICNQLSLHAVECEHLDIRIETRKESYDKERSDYHCHSRCIILCNNDIHSVFDIPDGGDVNAPNDPLFYFFVFILFCHCSCNIWRQHS